MHRRAFSIPELLLIGGTRAALGFGLGLLAAGKVSPHARKRAGWAMAAIGGLGSIPILAAVLRKPVLPERA